MKKLLKVSAIVLVFGLAAGCAGNQSIEAAQQTADNAARDAAAARSAAEAARAAADSAAQAAASAQRTADQALAAATEAQSCCEANRDRIERMFQQSQRK
ncbi:MAG: Lpp/OprI family alanine-zipper lipoprotein [Woeseiaceae bacterium]|nr:Lpp/OprI family alanine-zipper lipoprotein [Woeseiaceae bacterium]